MDYHVFKDAVNRYLSRYVGGDRRPVFHDISETCPALDRVTCHFADIREEWDALLASRIEMPQYHDIDPGEAAISHADGDTGRWNVFMLYLLGHKPEANRARCPATTALVDAVPGVVQAFFSILEPGKSVPLHEGPYLGYLRYHLGLQVPAERPPRIIVGGQSHTWREGEAVLFDDTWPHEVINQAESLRAVLVIDIMRPLPWLPALVNRAVMRGLAGPIYGRSVMRRVQAYRR